MSVLGVELVIAVVIVICVVASTNSDEAPGVQMGSVEFYDEFGDDVSNMVYTGGYVLIECLLTECRSSEPILVELKGPDGPIASGTCDQKVVLRFDISESAKFGAYRCKYGQQVSEVSFQFQYRFCSPLDDVCSKSCRDDGAEYCLIKDGQYTAQFNPCVVKEEVEFPIYFFCNPYDPQHIHMQKNSSGLVKYCGAEKQSKCQCPQPSSLCQAHSEGKLRFIKTRVFDPNVTASCYVDDSGSQQLHFPDQSAAYPTFSNLGYNRMLTTNDLRKYGTFEIPYRYTSGKLDVTINCTMKTPGGSIVWYRALRLTDHVFGDRYLRANFLMEHFRNITTIFRVIKLRCDFVQLNGFILADIGAYIIDVPFPAEKALIKANTTDDGRYTRALTCELQSPLPPPFVIQSYEWLVKTWHLVENSSIGGQEFIPKTNGTHRCVIHIMARCRKPSRDPDASLSSDKVEVVLMPEQPVCTSRGSVLVVVPQLGIIFPMLTILASRIVSLVIC